MREALLRHVPDAEVVSIPVADGGEGSVEAFLAAMGGHRVEVPCTGPDFRKISGFYGLLADGYTAVIEMAAAAGLPLMEGRLCAEGATTYGVGELILAAIRDGARRIILGLGGSATNDGGCGCAAALGVRFLDGTGAEYVPVGGTLDRLCRIDMSHRSPLLNGVEIVTMCDVDNPLCGPNGASAVFGPQKGADPDMVTRLDRNLRHLSEVIRQDLGREIADLPGAGAAGGMGAGVMAFLGSLPADGDRDSPGHRGLRCPAAWCHRGPDRRGPYRLSEPSGQGGHRHRPPGPAGTGPGGGRGGRRGPRRGGRLSRGRHRYRVHQPSRRALGGSPPVRPGRSVRRPGGSLPALQCVPDRPMT